LRPGWAPLRSGHEQATYTLCASVTRQYNLVPAKVGDLFGWESNREPGEKKCQPTSVFMTSVTCGLTAKKPGSAQCLTLVIENGTTLLLSIFANSLCL